MYIKYKNEDYHCICHIRKNTVSYRGLPKNFPSPVDGEITLYSSEGLKMRTDSVSDYEEQMFENGVLILANCPETSSEIIEDPQPTELEWLRADVDYIAIMTGVTL